MRLNNYYQKNLVFQQGKTFVVKGVLATASLDVFLKHDNKIIKPRLELNSDGSFNAVFEPLEASNIPFTLIATDQDTNIEISPIYCGDVYLCVGQSNMSVPLKYSEGKERYINKNKKHHSAYLTIEDSFINEEGFIYRPDRLLDDIGESSIWKSIEDNPLEFSSLSYMLLSMLDEKVDYPVAMVVVASGGVSIDTFISLDEIKNDIKVKDFLVKTDKYCEKEDRYDFVSFRRTGGIYNEKISPILDIGFKSIIYYQGENSAFDLENAIYFENALNLLIDSYRRCFKDEDLPFFVLGIADEYYCYGDTYGYAYITEALSNLKKENVFLVPYYDIEPKWLVKDGNTIYHPIHTSNKEKYAKRLFDIIYHNFYKKKTHIPPRVKSVKTLDDSLVLEIETFGSKFQKEASFDGFYVANSSGFYKKANAIVVDDNHIVLTSKNVDKPLYYLYGLFQYSYLANCKAINGLPLLPSRSKRESMDKIHYQTNHVYSCDVLRIVENNFGADVGGGFPIKLWERGTIYPKARMFISLNKKDKTEGSASIEIDAKLNKGCFGFFSVRANIGCAGQFHALGDFAYLNVDIKGDEDVSFCGSLFRYNGHINKFPVYGINEQEIPLKKEWKTYSIDLKKIIDGALGPSGVTKEIVGSLSYIELYFRTKKDQAIVLIDNLNLSDEPVLVKNDNNQNKQVESSIQVPGVQNEK